MNKRIGTNQSFIQIKNSVFIKDGHLLHLSVNPVPHVSFYITHVYITCVLFEIHLKNVIIYI